MRVNNTVLQIKSSCVCNYKQCITLYLFSVWSYYQEFYLVCGRTIKSVWYYNNTTSSICKILHTKSIELFHFIFVISHLLLCLMFKLACVCVYGNHISHFLPFTDMSRYELSEETPLRVTCKWPYVPVNEKGKYKNMKMLLNGLACYKESDWLKHVFTILL